MLQAGKLDQRITLQTKTVGKGASGGIVSSWAEFISVWADVRHLSGNERSATNAGGGQVAQARTEFGIRYRPGITAQMRVLYRGAVYNIVHVNNIRGGNERIVLTCDTGVNDG